MIQFVCDTCSSAKTPEEIWILGLAAEAVGITTARREVSILPLWDRERALHSLAVHFCSVECKDTYVEKLFNEEPANSLSPKRALAQATAATGVRKRSPRAGKLKPVRARRRKRAA